MSNLTKLALKLRLPETADAETVATEAINILDAAAKGLNLAANADVPALIEGFKAAATKTADTSGFVSKDEYSKLMDSVIDLTKQIRTGDANALCADAKRAGKFVAPEKQAWLLDQAIKDLANAKSIVSMAQAEVVVGRPGIVSAAEVPETTPADNESNGRKWAELAAKEHGLTLVNPAN